MVKAFLSISIRSEALLHLRFKDRIAVKKR